MPPSARPLNLALECARAAAGCRQTRPADADLLARFACDRDEDAFAELVRRHGSLVLGVARRRLADRHAAEDVVQGTFLALARQAGRLRADTVLPGWLHTVAYRLARKTQAAVGRRPMPRLPGDTASSTADPLAQVSGRELVALIDAELARLPVIYRLPLILCALEGLTRDEAAARLGWTVGALRGRLERGRDLLRTRLAASGLTVPTVLAGGLLASSAEAMPATLVQAVTRAAVVVPTAAMAVKLLVFAAVVLTALGVGTGVALMPGGQPGPKANPPMPMTVGPAVPQPRVDAEGVPLPPGVLARLGSSRMRHAENVYRAEFAPDNQSLAAAGVEGLRIWDNTTGKSIRSFASSEKTDLLALHHSAVPQELLTIWRGEPTSLRVYDAKTGRETRRVDMAAGYVQSATLSQSGRLAALVWLDSKLIRVVDTTTGKELFRLPVTGHVGRGMVFSPDDRTLAIAELPGKLRLHDTATGVVTAEFQKDGREGLFAIFSPNGRILVTLTVPITGSATDINLWDVPTGTLLRRITGPDVVSTLQVSFSPDGAYLATSGRYPDVILWETTTGREVRRFRCRTSVGVTAFSPDGKTLAAGSSWGTITLWNIATGELLPASADPILGFSEVRFADGGRRLVGTAERIITWDVATGREVIRYPPTVAGYHLPVVSPDLLPIIANRGDPRDGLAALSPDERLVASRGEPQDGLFPIDLRDAATGKVVRTVGGRTAFWSPVAFTPDSRRLIVADLDKQIHVFDVGDGRDLATFAGHKGSISKLAVSPDGRRLASMSADLSARGDWAVRVWDLRTFKEIRRIVPRRGSAFDAAFSPDGMRLVIVGGDPGRPNDRGEVQLWDLESGREVRSFEGHTERVGHVAFSPDGRALATGSLDNTLRLWEVSSGVERRRLTGHTGMIYSVAFSPNSRMLAASSPDAPVYLWDIYGRSDPQPLSTTDDLNQCWTDLAATDAAVAFRSIRRLIAAPDAATALFRDKLKLVPPADAARVKHLIDKLDSPKFADRQAAAKELESVADRAADQLWATLAETKSAEMRQALQAILDRLDAATPETLRAMRAVEVLEQVGTPTAHEQLKALAGGATGATLTRAAAEALKRLGSVPTGR
jgi:RNA polymerase sigma factor (sigma-70 family)